MNDTIRRLKNLLIVSSQASEGEPLCAPEHICALALSALNGGAGALRLEGVDNIEYVRKRVDVPIIGLTKDDNVDEKDRLSNVYITPTFEDAAALAKAGADVIALDCTLRPRPGGATAADIIKGIHDELGKPAWADVATYEEGVAAAEAGADVISTTLSGYTVETADSIDDGPDYDLLHRLTRATHVPIVLEGHVWVPEEVAKAFKIGAFAVVVGSAITRPQLITKRFVQAIPKA
jgi:N-acylglucosamine-6-phosphate 2-epimerase